MMMQQRVKSYYLAFRTTPSPPSKSAKEELMRWVWSKPFYLNNIAHSELLILTAPVFSADNLRCLPEESLVLLPHYHQAAL